MPVLDPKPICSRCHRSIEGSIEFQISSGCYDVTDGFWRQFARLDEKILCDGCMHADPEYQKVMVAGKLRGGAPMKSSLYNCGECGQPLEKCICAH